MNLNFNFNVQAHLILGSSNIAKDYIYKILQTIFCKKNNCNSCIVCIQLKNNLHSNVLFLEPEKQYNLEQIDLVLNKISHKLDNNEKFFIIFNQADALTPACSNRLLKSIEEPAAGYYFIFLAQRKETILPTIRSRCVVSNCNFSPDNYILEENAIINFFTSKNNDPLIFMKIIDKSNVNERDCINIIDSLICHWSGLCKNSLLNNEEKDYNYSTKILNVLNNAFKNPPMQGSSKIFLKNLFITMHNLN